MWREIPFEYLWIKGRKARYLQNEINSNSYVSPGLFAQRKSFQQQKLQSKYFLCFDVQHETYGREQHLSMMC